MRGEEKRSKKHARKKKKIKLRPSFQTHHVAVISGGIVVGVAVDGELLELQLEAFAQGAAVVVVVVVIIVIVIIVIIVILALTLALVLVGLLRPLCSAVLAVSPHDQQHILGVIIVVISRRAAAPLLPPRLSRSVEALLLVVSVRSRRLRPASIAADGAAQKSGPTGHDGGGPAQF